MVVDATCGRRSGRLPAHAVGAHRPPTATSRRTPRARRTRPGRWPSSPIGHRPSDDTIGISL